MASPCRKNDPRPKFSATNISFIKFISESCSKETNLKFPTCYVKKYQEKYGKELPRAAHLKLPCGAEWEVEVTGHNGHFWFEKGWEEFSKFYSLQSHDSLAFQYEGNSRFKVNIFDKSKTEIDYPIKCPNMQENYGNDHSPPATPLITQKKKLEATSSGGKKIFSAEKDEGGKSSTTQRSQKPTTEVHMGMYSSATGGKSTALRRAKEFKSRNPTCFLVTMYSSYIKRHALWLSTEISMNISTYLGNNSVIVSLCVSEESTGGAWTVEMKYDTERATFRFQGGWNKFVRANRLNVGDVCSFMLTDEAGLVFEVNIFRRTEVVTSSPGIDEDDVDDKDDNGHHDANVDHAADEKMLRSFRKVLQKSSMSHCLCLCSGFSRKYLRNKPNTAEFHVPGGTKTWLVGLKYDNGRQRARFQYNWTKFVKDNDLKIGDECVFVLTDEYKLSFEVVKVVAKSSLPPDTDTANDNIKDDEYSKNEDDDTDDDSDCNDEDEDDEYSSAKQLTHKRKRSSSSTKSSIKDVGVSTSTGQLLKRRPGVPRSIHPIKATGNDIAALQRAKAFKYVEPHFVISMTHRDVHEPFLKLPSAFVKEHLDMRPSHVSLWGSDGKYWPVELQFSKGARFQGGWIEFVQGHKLKDGDVCVFELTEKRKFLFDVHIFRTA
ncbi:B3 domain-containing protein LOC_Os12g40080-like [Argentina anserina]|uniref:B3 domain-containing protein LOC_Os12g40080-like n=1 Tax=Argentina anserina TaxID=57926 RepID=UPI0021767D0E|nr:B3 domain-containing protein LOC_Os12g40080-like [Potentilla anserina]